jgi:hypothetical protein
MFLWFKYKINFPVMGDLCIESYYIIQGDHKEKKQEIVQN